MRAKPSFSNVIFAIPFGKFIVRIAVIITIVPEIKNGK
jgi:hypothetical protein